MADVKRVDGCAPDLGHLLIVEDAVALARALEQLLGPHAESVTLAATRAEASAAIALRAPDLVLLDYALTDGSALDVLDALAQLRRAPAVVVMSGSASSEESFRLAQLGVRFFVAKPIDPIVLSSTLRRARPEPPELAPHVRQLVGLRGIHEVEEEVRATMVREALARAAGNRRGAARLLSVSRQLLQHILRRED